MINGESFPSSNVFSFLHTSSSYACARISRISVQCLPGKRGVAARQSNDTCVDCVEGTYNDKPGQASCIACDPGKVTDGRVGQTFCSACAAGTKHQPGDSSCTPCQLGKFTNKSGQISCTSCDSGKITNGMGQTFCSICDAGQFLYNWGTQTSKQSAHSSTFNRVVLNSATSPISFLNRSRQGIIERRAILHGMP